MSCKNCGLNFCNEFPIELCVSSLNIKTFLFNCYMVFLEKIVILQISELILPGPLSYTEQKFYLLLCIDI